MTLVKESGDNVILALEPNRKYILTNRISWLLLILAAPYYLIFSSLHLPTASLLVFPTLSVYVFCLIANYYKYERLAKAFLILGTSVSLCVYSNLLGESADAQLLFFPLSVVSFILFETKNKYLLWLCSTFPFLCLLLLELSFYHFLPFRESVSESVLFQIHMFAVITTFLMLVLSMRLLFMSNGQYESELIVRNNQLKEANINLKQKLILEKEMNIAKTIQDRLLPKQVPSIKGVCIDAISEPAHIVSGDFYEFRVINESCLDIVVADIVGKGLPACLHMVALKSILSTIYDSKLSPKQIMTLLNEAIIKDPVFITYLPIVICRLDMNFHTLTYCNAGHEPSLLQRENSVETLFSTGPVLGVDISDTFQEIHCSFYTNDSLYMFTDGFSESTNRFGEQFYSIINDSLHHSTAHILRKKVMKFSNDFLKDDLTIVSVNHL